MTEEKNKGLGPELEDALASRARLLGAGAAREVPLAEIPVEDRLAALCLQPRCPNYGLAASCPPNVGGPPELRRLLARAKGALAVGLDVPTEVLLSEQSREVFALLHEIVAGVEQEARKRGFPDSLALAGGSCKKIFCSDQPDCQVVVRGGPCRFPDLARPSLSGFGVNVDRMSRAAGLEMAWVTHGSPAEGSKLSSVRGLIVVAPDADAAFRGGHNR
ncbi:MAG: DUF2284 domain-containing protein [Pseudomonadota bacterium]